MSARGIHESKTGLVGCDGEATIGDLTVPGDLSISEVFDATY